LSPATLVAATIAIFVAHRHRRCSPATLFVIAIALSAIGLFVPFHPRRRRHRKADWCIVVIALAAITLFVARHPRRHRHCKADCCIIVIIASRIDVVIIIASPPSQTY
jgi:hypothetical protein